MALGIHLDGDILDIALLQKEGEEWHVQLVRSLPDKQEAVKQLLALTSPPAKRLQHAAGLGAEDIVYRSINLPIQRKQSLLASLPFQAETLLPFPIEKALILPFFEPQENKHTRVHLFATPYEKIERQIAQLQIYEIEPDILSATPIALWRYARYKAPKCPSLFVYHLGRTKSLFICIEKGRLVLSQAHSLSSDMALDPHFTERFRSEMTRISGFIEKKFQGALPSAAFFTGHFSPPFDPYPLIDLPKALEAAAPHAPFALPIGLALDATTEDRLQVNFRQGPFKAPTTLQRERKALKTYLLAALCLTICMGTMGYIGIKKRETALRSKLEERGIELHLCLAQEVSNWEQALAKQKMPFPCQLTIPTVSTVLAWLSTHPQIGEAEGIAIQSIRYQLIKYPKIEECSEPYSAKVEIEFISSLPKTARALREALLSNSGLANKSAPFEWHAEGDYYKTSFILK